MMYTIAFVLFINNLLMKHETCLRWIPDYPARWIVGNERKTSYE